MRQWNVGSLSCGHTHADAHQLRLHFHQRCGLGVQRHQFCVLQHIQPTLKAVPCQHGLVIYRRIQHRSRRIKQHAHFTHTATVVSRRVGAGRRCVASHRCGQAFEAVLAVERKQFCLVCGLHQNAINMRPARDVLAQIAIDFHADQLAACGQPVASLAQVLTRHAFDVIGMREQRI